MASVQIKKRNGTGYVYLVKSLRLGGQVKTIEKCIGKDPMTEDEIKALEEQSKPYFALKEAELKAAYAARNFASSNLSEDEIRELELLKTAYKNFISSLYPTELEACREAFEVSYVHNTTKIEGNTLTLSQTKLVLVDKIAPSEKELREIYEVRNYAEVLAFMKKYRGGLTEDLIRKLHSLIERDIDANTLGSFRRIDVAISGTEFTPSPHIMVEEDISKLIEWYEENKTKLHPVELAAVFHHRFEQIHPFTDGNGRVGRELFNFILKEFSFPPMNFEARKREKYLASLEEANTGNLKEIIGFAKTSLLEQNKKIIDRAIKQE